MTVTGAMIQQEIKKFDSLNFRVDGSSAAIKEIE